MLSGLRSSVRIRIGMGVWRQRRIRMLSSSSETNSESSNRRFAALWGNGDYGRLGLGSLDSQWTPVVCSSSAFHSQSLRSIACGGAHTLFLTESGLVYAAGLNDFGQLGVSDDKSYTTEPLHVCKLNKEVKQISAGYHHSCAITADGELYMWGKNSDGQLGLGKKAAKVVPLPAKLECLNGITMAMAALGAHHSIAVTDDGETLSWGGGASGSLGHGRKPGIRDLFKSASEFTPRLIKKLEGVKVKRVAAGLLHSACIDENGSVFMFGERVVDKLGFGDAKNATTPDMVGQLPFCEEVACGGYHTCVVTGGGELYTWGSNENGCLGTGCTNATSLPEKVQGPFSRESVSSVSCGWKHTAAISGGNVFTWGWGGANGTFSDDGHSSGGQLGHGNDIDYLGPTLVKFGQNVKALEVSCGFNHSGVILEYVQA